MSNKGALNDAEMNDSINVTREHESEQQLNPLTSFVRMRGPVFCQ